ncbi:hypothetical protein CV686_04665, partial [Borreliella burgdorferi]
IYDEEVLNTGMSELIKKENIVVMLTMKYFIKRLSQNVYKLQGCGENGLSMIDIYVVGEIDIATCVMSQNDYVMILI